LIIKTQTILISDVFLTNFLLQYTTVAQLSKDNSKAKDSDNATVVYCKRKFVKKTSDMNAGQVKVDYKNANDININE
jgi:hypothetical protein